MMNIVLAAAMPSTGPTSAPDVDLTQLDRSLVLRFSQPEQINTDRALQIVGQPLGGRKTSLRRWLFFRLGHQRVMVGATKAIAALLDDRDQ